MENWVKDGYKFARKNIAAQSGCNHGDNYVQKVCSAIDALSDDVNRFSGYKTDADKLQGDLAEFWHGDTFNLNAAVADSKYTVSIDRSHDYASADIKGNWNESYGLKYYKNAIASSKAQSISHFQRFCEYKSSSGRSNLTITDFLSERGLDDDTILNDPIYSGQILIIPSDQYKASVTYLKIKIEKEAMTRPEQVERYKNTLRMLTTNVKAPDGNHSVELSRETSEKLAKLAKEGKFNAADYGFTTEQLINFQHALQQGVKAGTTAAVISLVLKTDPELYKCFENLINEGNINEKDLKELGFAAINGAGEGFIRGFIAGTLTTACESGMFGVVLKNVSPGCVAALTVVLLQSMKDSFAVVKGDITQYELMANISKNIFVTSCGIGLGVLAQSIMPVLPFAYLVGNFVGSFVGSFAYFTADNAILSFAIISGWTVFGLVKQNYVLPDEVMNEIGIDLFDYEKLDYNCFHFDEFKPDYFEFDEYKPQFISMLRRGVISVHQIGYMFTKE
jgi:hypothetical protein